ncbi:hypothetical protein VCRA2120O333_10362 [Vibrio crassostreae]|nr:hypothetical protein VCRA2113O323_30189 [Vibrio crassostreae]CAK2905639.1 hypothetical protein VCRA2113O325_30189 [Vibrio crassostreae]CAK2946646.1 hypothetical protein VCRA2121O336_30174 [Vibrio crassostreae]CAK3331396.1 hypothetical protein VCRA2122O341_10360 [Vibrio crassostreae]CAK3463815.1 hypothetical protein VCRA2120O329_30171 [Vibrio crassostreae]
MSYPNQSHLVIRWFFFYLLFEGDYYPKNLISVSGLSIVNGYIAYLMSE